MLKALLLSIRGFFRKKVEENTDLRYAGREHIRDVNVAIQNLRDQRNLVAGTALVSSNRASDLKTRMDTAADAVRHWDKNQDPVRKAEAYAVYSETKPRYDAQVETLKQQETTVKNLDAKIAELENDTLAAKNQLEQAATTQQMARTSAQVETIHVDLSNGPLAGVIETAELQNATATAAMEQRKKQDRSDVLNINRSIPSMDDLCK